MSILASEWIKTKRTPIRWLTFLAPMIFSGLIIWYFSLRPIKIDTQISIFQAFFEVWTAFVIPLGAGLISGIMIHQEELAGNFNGLLLNKLPRQKLYLGKLATAILLASISTLIATLVLLVGVGFVLKIPISWLIFIIAALMAIIGSIPLLAFHLWISFAWGIGASIGIGGGGVLIAALMITSLGDRIWQFVPWAWPVRFSMVPGFYLLYNPGTNFITKIIYSFIPAAIFFVIMLIGGIMWFNKWEGRKIYE